MQRRFQIMIDSRMQLSRMHAIKGELAQSRIGGLFQKDSYAQLVLSQASNTGTEF